MSVISIYGIKAEVNIFGHTAHSHTLCRTLYNILCTSLCSTSYGVYTCIMLML